MQISTTTILHLFGLAVCGKNLRQYTFIQPILTLSYKPVRRLFIGQFNGVRCLKVL
jgi:hypothetical protein